MNSILFEENISSKGGSIYLQDSNIILISSQFRKDNSTYGGSIYSENSMLNITNSQFDNCKSSFGGCIYVYQGSLNLDTVNSTYATADQDGGFLFINAANKFILTNVNTQYCYAYSDGGSIYIINSGGINSYITASNFYNNKALGSGGVLLLDNSELFIDFSSFKNNQAGVGGAIRYLNLKPSFLFNRQKYAKDSCKTYSFNQCKQNKAIIFGNQIASYPTYASIFPSSLFNIDIRQYPNITFNNFRSGLNNFDLFIQFLDEFKDLVNQIDFQNQTKIDQISQKLLNEIRQYSCRLYINQNFTDLKSEVIKLDGAISVDYSFYGQNKIGCSMNNFKITGVPESSSSIMLQLNGMRVANNSQQFVDLNNIQIKIEFRSCEIGEFYSQNCEGCQLYECSQCQNGTYSLIQPNKDSQIQCKQCDVSLVESCYLNQINLRENYWRISNESDQIYECSNTQCNGKESQGYCATGYTGALCSICDNYGMIWGDQYGSIVSLNNEILQCEKCSQISQNFYKLQELYYEITVLIVQIRAIGCPFRLNGSTNQDLNVQEIIILKSNPQSDIQDIAAVVYKPFTVAVSFKSIQGQNFVASYKENRLEFITSFSQLSTNVLVSNQENLLVLVGQNNLFKIWDLESNSLIYNPDFQKIYCDQRDANYTKVADVINFKFSSINENDEVVAVSDQYIFAFSLKEQKPLIFKSQNLGFNWIQAFIVKNDIILGQTHSVTNIDIRSSRINYLMNYFSKGLFSCCAYPGTVIVWDMQNNFKKIKTLKEIAQISYVTQIMFYPQKGILMVLGYCWWSYTVDYYTLEKKCQIEGIYGNFDYSHNLQITWDQNGDFRIFDFDCSQLAYQHAHTGWIQQLLIDENNMLLITIGYFIYFID
ncbi:hypothetical protein ABPG73_019688 [Tetrahymena malaccensis]